MTFTDIDGVLTLEETGSKSVLLGGTDFSENGLFDISSPFEANGIFHPFADSSALFADIGTTYIFLTGDIDTAARFDSIDHSLSGQYRFDLIYSSNSIAVELVDIVGVPEPSSTFILLGTLLGVGMIRRRI